MTISSASISLAVNPVTAYNTAGTASQSDQIAGRLRFAALLGLDPSSMTGGDVSEAPIDTVTLHRQEFAAAVRPVPTASRDSVVIGSAAATPPPAAAVSTPDPSAAPAGPKDLTNITVPAGTIVDGMVSAGPLSPGLASMLGPLPPLSGTRLLPVAPDAAQFNYDPIAMIRDRLTKLGVNPASIQFDQWTDAIQSPGGNRSNQYVRATFANGVTENFAVERVLQNPDITGVEIQSLIARGFQAA